MLMSAINSKERTTLPKPVREALGVGAGDRVRYVILGNAVLVLPVGTWASIMKQAALEE